MNIYTCPKVILIAYPELNSIGIKYFLTSNGTPGGWVVEDDRVSQGELLPEFAGRMCYNSFGRKQGRKSNQEYLSNIIKMGHGSVLEHANYSFLVIKASRGFTHEMVRHRAGFAYSQESTHFIDYTDPINWSICLDYNMSKTNPTYVINAAEEAKSSFKTYGKIYTSLKERGIPKKQACSMARQVLPIGIESKLAFTANVRALRHFIEYRCNPHNVLEIAEVAYQVAEIMKVMAPNMFDDIELRSGMDDGGMLYKEAISKHAKV